jgi:hypothetical protein
VLGLTKPIFVTFNWQGQTIWLIAASAHSDRKESEQKAEPSPPIPTNLIKQQLFSFLFR